MTNNMQPYPTSKDQVGLETNLKCFHCVFFQTKFGEPMYQRTDNLFAVISKFSEKFKSAMRDIDKGMERKSSSSSLSWWWQETQQTLMCHKAEIIPMTLTYMHWRSSHYAFTHVRKKIVTFKGGHLMWISDFSYHMELILKGKNSLPLGSLWEQILSFKRSSHFEKWRNWRSSSLPLPCVTFFSVIDTPLYIYLYQLGWMEQWQSLAYMACVPYSINIFLFSYMNLLHNA